MRFALALTALRASRPSSTLPSKDLQLLQPNWPTFSPEIPETPAVALKNVRHEEDSYSENGNTPARLRQR